MLLLLSHSNVAESITLSGDERELGKVCVRLNYQEALEQVWITLVQVRLHVVRRGGPETTKSSIMLFCSISQWTLCVSRTQASVSSPQCSINFGSDTQEEKVELQETELSPLLLKHSNPCIWGSVRSRKRQHLQCVYCFKALMQRHALIPQGTGKNEKGAPLSPQCSTSIGTFR